MPFSLIPSGATAFELEHLFRTSEATRLFVHPSLLPTARETAHKFGITDDRILLLDVSGPETALVKVACQIPPRYFTDYLVLNRTRAGWKIVSKVYRAETRG